MVGKNGDKILIWDYFVWLIFHFRIYILGHRNDLAYSLTY